MSFRGDDLKFEFDFKLLNTALVSDSFFYTLSMWSRACDYAMDFSFGNSVPTRL